MKFVNILNCRWKRKKDGKKILNKSWIIKGHFQNYLNFFINILKFNYSMDLTLINNLYICNNNFCIKIVITFYIKYFRNDFFLNIN